MSEKDFTKISIAHSPEFYNLPGSKIFNFDFLKSLLFTIDLSKTKDRLSK